MQGYTTVNTTCGELRGFEHCGIVSFLGIPYAEAPVGPLRFQPAVTKRPWGGVRDALTWGAVSIQPDTRLDAHSRDRMEVMRLMYPKGGNPLEGNAMSEDCLFLNVWTPSVEGRRPVMVWLHGGGFVQGSGSINLYEGDNLADLGNVVVVTLNHRLGITGFMPLDDEGFAGSANAGMTDIVEALRWVKANAAAFGGDAENITVFGQSGGGMKVSTLMAMPSAQGLFHKAIAMSGPGLRVGTLEAAATVRNRVFASAGVSSARELQALPIERLLEVAMALGAGGGGVFSLSPQPSDGGGLMAFHPVVDGVWIPRHPMDPAPSDAVDDIPLIVGFTTHDPSFLFIDDPLWRTLDDTGVRAWTTRVFGPAGDGIVDIYRAQSTEETPQLLLSRIAAHALFGAGSIAMAERKSRQSAPVYSYEFAYQADVLPGLLGASHSMDLPFVFNNTVRSPFAGTEPVRHEVARNFALAFARFAWTGDPAHAGIPEWPAYSEESRATMVFDRTCGLKQGPASERIPNVGLGL